MRNKSFVRFCVVGVINTLIDVPVFVVLHASGLSILLANICSTTLALFASFILNYKYTFQSRKLTSFKIFIYVSATLVGLWLLQPLVIRGVLNVNNHWHITSLAIQLLGHTAAVNNTFAKLASIAVTMVWNYLWYSRVVFANTKQATAETLTTSV